MCATHQDTTVFNQADPNGPSKLTTLSLGDDPEPALQREMQSAREDAYVKPFARLFGGIGLVVVLALLGVVYNDYLAHKQELPGLIARGRRVPAQLSGEPVSVSGRRNYSGGRWSVEYSYTVDGRAHAGSAYMYAYDRPASITVVFDPQNPAAHRAIGSVEPSNVDRRRLMMLGAAAVVFGFIVVVSAIEWFDKGGHSAPGR
jgi:hypothetical protein